MHPEPTRRSRLAMTVLKAAAALALAGAAVTVFLQWLDAGETTEDAYVEGNIVQLTPQQGGSVVLIGADNTDFVQVGQTLVQLNDIDTQLAVERAEAQLSKAVRQVRVQMANAGQMRATVTQRAAELARAEDDLERRQQLGGSGAISGEELAHARQAARSAAAAMTVAEQQMAASQAMVDRSGIADHPDVRVAAAQLRDAYVARARTTLRAPVGGIVSKRNVQLGQRVNAGTVLMSIVPPEQMWVNANFKETQLRHIRIGQPVILTADLYGKSVRYRGTVTGQDAGTGNAFSLLPAQNATGNWIKVMQRVPVRIALEQGELRAHPLKLGLSMHVEVDTRERSGPLANAQPAQRSHYETRIFRDELAQTEQRIAQLIAASLGSSAPTGAR